MLNFNFYFVVVWFFNLLGKFKNNLSFILSVYYATLCDKIRLVINVYIEESK